LNAEKKAEMEAKVAEHTKEKEALNVHRWSCGLMMVDKIART
jgi:hypothetical protein